MRKLQLSIAGFVLALGSLAWWGWVPENVSDARCRLERNAAWIDVDWTSKPVTEPAIRDLVKRTADRRIRYLFPYTTYVKQDGTFSPSYNYASLFVSQFRALNRETLLLAWVGLPLKNERSIGIKGWVDLADPSTRRRIVTFVATLVHGAGFDGIHLNAETVRNNDPAYLLLLDEMRQAIGAFKISVAGSHWVPDALNALPPIHDFRWTGDYYRQVARRVDQIVTMTYDSYAPSDALYRLWVREQVRGISRDLAQSPAELLIGISVSRDETRSHRPSAENLRNGLAGLCAALSDGGTSVQGAAIYADWEFSPDERRVWDGWQKGEPVR